MAELEVHSIYQLAASTPSSICCAHSPQQQQAARDLSFSISYVHRERLAAAPTYTEDPICMHTNVYKTYAMNVNFVNSLQGLLAQASATLLLANIHTYIGL